MKNLKKYFLIDKEKRKRKKLSQFICRELRKSTPDLTIKESEKNILNFTLDIYIASLKLGFIFRKLYINPYDVEIKSGISKKINTCKENDIKLYVLDIDEFIGFDKTRILLCSNEILSKILYCKYYG